MLGSLLPFNWIRDLGDAPLVQRIITWTGLRVFHLSVPPSFQTTGSGDRMADTGPNTPPAIFKFDRPHPERLILDGSLDGHAIHMETTLFDPAKFPLLSRGFNWIQERPFNR